jgi:predicted nucleic acid-binding protein
MRVVVADTSPLRYLVEIGHISVLFRLYQTVLIPEPVYRELLHSSAPSIVREWATAPPDWLKVMAPPPTTDPALLSLHAGERSALALGLSLHADLILIDERKGASVARQKGLAITGTLGILVRAKQANLLSLAAAFARLRKTTFHCSDDLMTSLIARHDADKEE